MINLKKISDLFLALSLILFPFGIKTIINTETVYKSGNFNFYTTSFLYLTDILIILSLLFLTLNLIKTKTKLILPNKQTLTIITATFLLTAINYIFTNIKNTQLFTTSIFHLTILITLLILLINTNLKQTTILKLLLIPLITQSIIAIIQITLNHSIGLKFLGEPILDPNTPGTAKFGIQSIKTIRAYGTTMHPNILAGLLITLIILTKKIWQTKKHIIILPLLALLLTFSRETFLAIALTSIIILIKNKQIKTIIISTTLITLTLITIQFINKNIIPHLIFKDSTTSITERLSYIKDTTNIIKQHPITGIGISNYTTKLQDYTEKKYQPWQIQPVHNIPLLIQSETGILGLILFIQFIILTLKQSTNTTKPIIIILLIISLLDHYLITTQTGLILTTLTFSFPFIKQKNHDFQLKNS